MHIGDHTHEVESDQEYEVMMCMTRFDFLSRKEKSIPDTGSTCSIVKERNLLPDIVEAKETLKLIINGGSFAADQIGILDKALEWCSENSVSNLSSVHGLNISSLFVSRTKKTQCM